MGDHLYVESEPLHDTGNGTYRCRRPGQKQFERLRDVIKHNLSYLLFLYIKDFKAQLSTVEQAVLDIPEIDSIPMQRAEFEKLISEPIAAVAQALIWLRKPDCNMTT